MGGGAKGGGGGLLPDSTVCIPKSLSTIPKGSYLDPSLQRDSIPLPTRKPSEKKDNSTALKPSDYEKIGRKLLPSFPAPAAPEKPPEDELYYDRIDDYGYPAYEEPVKS